MPSFSRVAHVAIGLLFLVPASPAPARAQSPDPNGAPVINTPDSPLLHGFRWRSIGPVGAGGRVDDIAVDEKNPSTYYIGFAVGGIQKTTNNGTSFEGVFDTYGSSSIADIALAPSNPSVVYVATGEANNRQTTSYGDGLYKSTDAGKTFTNVGFRRRADARPHRRAPARPEHGLGRGRRPPLRSESRTWRLQDCRRRKVRGRRCCTSTRTQVRRTS